LKSIPSIKDGVEVVGEQRGRSAVQFVGAPVDVGEFFRDAAQFREVGPASIPRPS
jgi:hypothetical protein